ncbi:MAG: RNA 3'-terminal phosphate cyclase [Planctomycetota bacterium]
MQRIDGSQGEGGGQVLRSSLALSMVTGQPFRIENIRAGRSKPGLMRQHLTGVRAAVAVCGGEAEGDALRSTALSFTPGSVRAGDYRFSIGTAGSTTLVLQTVLPALVLADGPSTVTLEGGTHNPFAPPFDFLAKTYLPLLNNMGPNVTATLERPGFFPAGGGALRVEIEPATTGKLTGFELMKRGEIVRRRAVATVANLPREIAERELKVARRKLGWNEAACAVQEVKDSPGPGNLVTLEIESAGADEAPGVCEVFTGFGEVGRKAEVVANAAVRQAQRYLKSLAPVGEYLADQLLLPMAIAGGGSYRAQTFSRHTRTHVDLVQRFLDVRIAADDRGREGVTIRVSR